MGTASDREVPSADSDRESSGGRGTAAGPGFASGEALLDVDRVTLCYGTRVVLQEVSLSLERGRILAILGPNGAGKSTLIRAACGVLDPREGSILVGGADLHGLSVPERARRVAVVPQAARLPEAFTVGDTVLLGRTAHVGWLGRETDRDRSVARAALERTGTAHLAERRIEELSGGERQLVLIARALAQAAPVLLMDEPTAHLDLKHQVEILGLCRSLAHEDGHAVLLALHDLNLAAHFADRVALLSRGRLVAIGPPGTVLTEENLSRVYDLPVRIFPHPVHGTPVIFPDSEEGRSVGQPSASPRRQP